MPWIKKISEAIIETVIIPLTVKVRTRVIPYRPRRAEITIGISKRTTMASNSQLGPIVRGSGRARYTPAAANMATKAGQRGSRRTCCFISLRRSAKNSVIRLDPVELNAAYRRSLVFQPLCQRFVLS
jgi:hypothetical protein